MRLIQAPGIQTTELDRSGYADLTDKSKVNTASFFCGFTDKGINYEKKYVNSMATFEKMFGAPTNEAERYLYNGVYETIDRGGNAYVAKLPYDNNSRNKFNYCKYNLIPELYTTKDSALSDVLSVDESLTSFMCLTSSPWESNGMIDMETYDNLKIGTQKVDENEIMIIDITNGRYTEERNILYSDSHREYVGLLPVITTAANAMYVQGLIDTEHVTVFNYTAIKDIQNQYTVSSELKMSNMNNDLSDIVGFTQNIGGETTKDIDENSYTLSRTAVEMFPSLIFEGGHLERKFLKQIGIVVFEMFVDTANENKIGFTPLEAFAGSLDSRETDKDTKATAFIDTIVNQNSSRINLFSNVKFAQSRSEALKITDKAQFFNITNQTATSLGFYSGDTLKQISLNTSILKALDMIFHNAKDINTFEIDLVVDCGTSNIAQFIKTCYGDDKGYFDWNLDIAGNFTASQNKAWKQVLMKYDDFCKNVRKDCMFIADGLRPLCISKNEKRVRNTKPENTIENTILKDVKYIAGHINSSYGAGYCDWFYAIDRYTNDYFWCPPSIKANGIYIYTDAYSHYWDAPAGMNRGVLPSDVIDVAFNPTNEEAGKIYNSQWNYAISYPINGIVQEGQKTFQRNKTALDRVNVRRLMLGLEKNVRFVAKYFTYEGITDYMMERFNDAVDYILADAKDNGGILDYYIICDSRNNNTQTIENNELHCTIAIKPVKSLEFICINFIATSQGANVQEVAESEL